MAELSSKALANFTAASSALVLTGSLRLIRNYRYYNNLSENSVSRDQLVDKIRQVRKLAFSLQNLMSKDQPEEAPFFVSIAGRINDLLEEIHRNALFFDAENIVDTIPMIDRQRKFWGDFNEMEFYGESLIRKLDSAIPETLLNIEKNIKNLPPFATV